MTSLHHQPSSPSHSTPPSSPPPTSSPSEDGNDDSDDFFSSSAAETDLLSSHLERTHVTEGVRAGIAASKGVNVQAGFDEGYMLGAILGLKCGEILGVIEGVVAGLSTSTSSGSRSGAGSTVPQTHSSANKKKLAAVSEKLYTEVSVEGSSSSTSSKAIASGGSSGSGTVEKEEFEMPSELRAWKKLQLRAKEDLRLEVVCGKEYFNQDGLWKWSVKNGAVNAWEKSTVATERSTIQKAMQGAIDFTTTEGTAVGEITDGKVDENEEAEEEEEEEEEGITFYDVATAHPLITRWARLVEDETAKLGIHLGRLNEGMQS